jgi:hypothetical protein
MSAKERMLSYLKPGQYDHDPVMQDVYSTQGVEIDELNRTLDEILDQFYIQFATWGLRLYEEQYGLPVNEGLDPELRRALIMARKRRGRNSLLKILHAVEPTLSLAWGHLILPFSLESDADDYDISALIQLLERHKPAHLSYSFRVIPTLPDSAYTIRANHFMRNRIKLELIAGTARAGHWPWWSTPGLSIQGGVGVQSVPVVGDCLYDPVGTLYSGPVRDRENIAVTATIFPAVELCDVTAAATYFQAGTFRSGERPTVTTEGQSQSFAIYSDQEAITGHSTAFPCGVYHCGEEVA